MPQLSEDANTTGSGQADLEKKIARVGRRLASTLRAVLDAVPGGPHRPQALAETLGLDKVLTSRLLKALRHRDPMSVVHLAPGPDPLRRMIRAARRRGAAGTDVDEANEAIDAFDRLIRREIGDRSALDAILSSWLPEARQQFEIRRKQAVYRAMSELKGARLDVSLGTVILNPSDDGEHVDIIWIIGLMGLHRLRPGAGVKFATRRIAGDEKHRSPLTLGGESIDGMRGVRLDQFCEAPPAPLNVHCVGDVNHYTLAGDSFGPGTGVDFVLAEVNMAEIERYVPREEQRKAHVFTEIATPSKMMLFDVFVHDELYAGVEPELVIYDTVLDGVASVNDRTRDVDRLDLLESIAMLGRGTAKCRAAEIPNYVDMLRHVFGRMGWDEQRFRCYRSRIEFPIYGSQVVMAFNAPPPPDGS